MNTVPGSTAVAWVQFSNGCSMVYKDFEEWENAAEASARVDDEPPRVPDADEDERRADHASPRANPVPPPRAVPVRVLGPVPMDGAGADRLGLPS